MNEFKPVSRDSIGLRLFQPFQMTRYGRMPHKTNFRAQRDCAPLFLPINNPFASKVQLQLVTAKPL